MATNKFKFRRPDIRKNDTISYEQLDEIRVNKIVNQMSAILNDPDDSSTSTNTASSAKTAFFSPMSSFGQMSDGSQLPQLPMGSAGLMKESDSSIENTTSVSSPSMEQLKNTRPSSSTSSGFINSRSTTTMLSNDSNQYQSSSAPDLFRESSSQKNVDLKESSKSLDLMKPDLPDVPNPAESTLQNTSTVSIQFYSQPHLPEQQKLQSKTLVNNTSSGNIQFYSPRHSLEPDPKNNPASLSTEPVAEQQPEPPTIPDFQNESELDSTIDNEKLPLLPNNEGSQNFRDNEKSFLVESKDKFRNIDDDSSSCCSGCCKSKSYEMSSSFTNLIFRDQFISKILSYKIYQMLFIFTTCLIFQIIVYVSRSNEEIEEPKPTPIYMPRQPIYLGLVALFIKLYIILLAILRCYQFGRTRAASRIIFCVLTTILCLISYGLIIVLGEKNAVIVPLVTCSLLLSYVVLRVPISTEDCDLYICCCKFMREQLDLTKQRVYLAIVPITMLTFGLSLLIVCGLLQLINLVFEVEGFLIMPHILSEHMLRISLLSFAFVCIFLLTEICRLRGTISGSVVSLDRNEELYASLFV